MVFTNASAQVALRTLRAAEASLFKTQDRISTGLKVSRPDDNPAFFLVAATQRSDVVKLRGARENLTYALGAVQTAQSAQQTVDTALNNIRSAIVALETGSAQGELQTIIEQQVDQVRRAIDATSFNGLNLLAGRERFIFDAGAQRSSTGGLSFEQIQIDAAGLTVSSPPIDTTAPPLPGSVQDLNSQNLFGAPGQLAGLEPANANGVNIGPGQAAFPQKTFAISFETGADINTQQVIYEQGGNVRGLNIFVENGQLVFGGYNLVASDPSPPWTYREVRASIEANTRYTAQLVLDGNTSNTGSFRAYVDGVLIDEVDGVGVLYEHGGGIGVGKINGNGVINGAVVNETPATEFQGLIDKVIQYNEVFSGPEFDQITSYLAEDWLPPQGIQFFIGSPERRERATLIELLNALVPIDQAGFTVSGALEVLESAQAKVNIAFSNIGATERRIVRQREYLATLISSMEEGIAALVEADLAEESAKQQAFQVQTQLAQQALVIANRRPQTILSLFSS